MHHRHHAPRDHDNGPVRSKAHAFTASQPHARRTSRTRACCSRVVEVGLDRAEIEPPSEVALRASSGPATLRANKDKDDRRKEPTQHEEGVVKVDGPARAQAAHGLVGSRWVVGEWVSKSVSK